MVYILGSSFGTVSHNFIWYYPKRNGCHTGLGSGQKLELNLPACSRSLGRSRRELVRGGGSLIRSRGSPFSIF